MISICPYCQKQLTFSEGQAEKIRLAIVNLPQGKTLKFACPLCREPIELRSDGSLVENLLQPGNKIGSPSAQKQKNMPAPPGPPDIEWLISDAFSEEEVIEDVPKVLILMPGNETKELVGKAFREIGYQTVSAESASDAMEKMRFVNYHVVIYHADFEPGRIQESSFHNHMRSMAMDRRRQVFYILVGPQFHTLYDLEALSMSANVVVNENDVKKMQLIFRKGMHDYEELIGPLLAMMKQLGKK